VPFFPVIDFAGTSQFASEQLTLFDTDTDGKITLGELATLNSDNSAGISALSGVSLTDPTPVDHEMLLAILNTDNTGDSRDVIDITEAAALLGGTPAAVTAAETADVDGDGKIDPLGYEVGTGGEEPVYLSMDSPLIRAQGIVELNLFDVVILTGSVNFELGPTETMTLTDGNTKDVTTMTIGAAKVSAFIGVNGPYSIGGDAVGFHVTDLDVGIMLMAAIDPLDLGVYLAAKLNVNSFGLVGIDGLSATGAFDIELNVGVGLSGLEPSVNPVDFDASFNEVYALFDVIDTGGNGIIEESELNNALDEGYVGADVGTVEQLVLALNISGAPQTAGISVTDLLNTLSTSFKTTANINSIQAADADADGKLDFGFEVNTGDASSPVVLDFDQFLISLQLGGEIELTDVFRMYGVFLFEVDSSGLKAFVAAGLEIGPDIGSDDNDKIFAMNALGALVINGDGIAGDIDVSASVGGALSSVLDFNASARVVFNTTGVDQTITIPARYVDYLDGTVDLASSFIGKELHDLGMDTSQLSVLTGALDEERFFINDDDGSATFTINGGAPRLDDGFDAPGAYFLISLHGDLTIARTFVITADFHLKISGQALELGFKGEIDLGGFASLDVEGGAVIEDGVFAAYAALTVNIDIDVPGINKDIKISGTADFEINTASSGSPDKIVYDAQGNPHPISANTFRVAIDATSADAGIDFFGVLTAKGSVDVQVVNNVFSIDVDASLNFFGIVDIDILGYFNTNGTFSFTGTLDLDLKADLGILGIYGIDGSLGITISNSGFSGHGEVALVIASQNINIASATLSVDWTDGDFLIRAEGPLSVWLEVTPSDSFPFFSITGGLGLFDDVLGALGDVAEAVGEAVAAAAQAVVGAIEDLGKAILDFGEDVLNFIGGLFTDIGNLIGDVIDEIASWFESSKTEVTDLTDDIVPNYSYSAYLNPLNGTLTITNSSASKLCLAVVNGQLVVDAPDVTRSVIVAEKVHYTRHFRWWGPVPLGWSSWSEHCSEYIYRTVTFSNMTSFPADFVDKIVINGSNSSETIILDRASISINTDVYGNGGNDIIVTGQGDDRVWGGDDDDTIFTYEGDDRLYGQDDHDKLMGGTGIDYLDGGSGNDLLDESQGRASPSTLISETNTLRGGDGDDIILGSPGIDTIEGGSGNDLLTGLYNNDIYVFKNGYGKDQFADYYGEETLDFYGYILDSSGATHALTIAMSDTGFTASAGTNNYLEIDNLVWIAEVRTGLGNDNLAITALPNHQINIVDNGGTNDRILLDLDSTGFDIYLHPLAVLMHNLNLTFNRGIEYLNLTDHAAQTTITTEPISGPTTLLVKSGVTILSETDGPIELHARDNLTLRAGSLIETAGNVTIRGDYGHDDSNGSNIDLLGTINADQVTVFGNIDNDTVNVANVTIDSETTIWTYAGSDIVNIQTINAETTVNAGAGNDTINVGSNAPATGGNVNSISAALTINGDGGSDTLNLDDTGDTADNDGTLTSTMITGLGMSTGITYGTLEHLNINLGSGGDTYTIQSTHTQETTLHANDGADTVHVLTVDGQTTINAGNQADVINVRTISAATTVNAGAGDDTINVGSNAQGVIGDVNNNSGGTVDGIGALLTVNGNEPSSGSDTLNIDNTGDTSGSTGNLTSTQLHGLGMASGITYGTIETLNISLGSGGDTFTIQSTHSGSTTVSTGAGEDAIVINGADGTLTVNGQADGDVITINATGASSSSTLNGQAGEDAIVINGTDGTLTVNGQADGDVITVNATGASSSSTLNGQAGEDAIVINGTDGTLTVNGQADSDVITVNGTGASSSSTLNGQAGNDIFNIKAINGPVVVSGGDDSDTINVGSNAAGVIGDEDNNQGGNVNSIAALLTVSGNEPSSGSDTLNVDDTGDTSGNTGNLTSTQLTGLGMASGIIYGTIETLNISLGSGGDTFTIQSTHAGQTNLNSNAGSDVINIQTIAGLTTVNGGNDSDTINVGSNAQGTIANANNNSGGTVDGIGALLTVNGNEPPSGSDTLNVDDTAETTNNTGTLTATTITGLDMGGSIVYGTVETLNINLGGFVDTFTIISTHAGATNLNGNAGADIINIRTIAGATTVNGGNDSDTINVGSNAQGVIGDVNNNSGGTVDGIGALLTVNGNAPSSSSDTLNVDDTAETTNNTGTLTATAITGLDMGGSIAYGTVETLNINLGEFVDTFTITSTHVGVTTLNTNGGADTVHVLSVAGVTTVNTGNADDVVNVQSISASTTVNAGAGDDTVNVGSLAPATGGDVNSISAALTINGDGGTNDVLNVDDTADSLANTGNLTSTQLTDLGMAVGITYGTLETVNIDLGSGGDTFTISSTHTGTTTLDN
jgi:Ca2+-binding EF-hand superfamily protein